MFQIDEIMGLTNVPCDIFMRDCSLPTVDWTRKCPPDEVLQHLPFRFGFWPDKTTAPAITKKKIKVDRTTIVDECALPKLKSVNVEKCDLFLPKMSEIGIESEDINWLKYRDDFCTKRRILTDQLSIFDSDGNLAEGVEYQMDFLKFVLEANTEAFAAMLMESIFIGDDANPYQFDGFFTQLLKGWDMSSDCPCPPELNKCVELDWSVLTDAPVGSCSKPDAVIGAGKTINLWGQDCTAPAGKNLAQFIDWYAERVEVEWTMAIGGVTSWDLLVGWLQTNCLLDAASCLRPCEGCFELFDESVRARFSEARRTKVLQPYPSSLRIPIMQSRYVEADEMWLGPSVIGGKPTYALFFDNIDRYLGTLPDNMKGFMGLPSGSMDPLLPHQLEDLKKKFETNAIYWDVYKRSIKCLYAGILARVGMLVCARHLWLHLTHVCCDGCAPDCNVDSGVEFV